MIKEGNEDETVDRYRMRPFRPSQEKEQLLSAAVINQELM